ncbi:hypothetical protein C8J57DRAFT_1529215 [Mycena rebaudengoi]|nr:hypothetical protein C8J57DRAFT_1529215 [Mycena rebaudengoi]
MSSIPPNLIPCGGVDNVNDGCMEIFPRSQPTTDTFCSKCKKLQAASTPAIRAQLEEDLKSCQGCGLCGTSLKTAMCGTCRRKDLEERGEADPAVVAGQQQRLDKIQRSLGTARPPLHNTTNHALGATTSVGELEKLRAANQKGTWTILVIPRRGSKADSEMGNSTFIVSGDTTMEDLFVQIMETFNLQWCRLTGHSLNLKCDECSLRFNGNIGMHANVDDMTVQGMHDWYQKRSDRSLILVDTKLKLPKLSSMVFNFVINEKSYLQRLKMLEIDGESDLGSKRKSARSTSVAQKRHKGPLTSTFRNNDDFSVLSSAPATVKVTFRIIQCKSNNDDGGQVLFLDPTAGVQVGFMEVETLILSVRDRGKSKDVRKFTIEGATQPYVAKKIFDIDKGRDVDIDASTNRSLLGRELVRLKRMAWFHGEFMSAAQNKGVDSELADFNVSDGFMISVQKDTETGSEHDSGGDTYLIEPLRSTVITKFTGTFGSSCDTNKLSSTILAFGHFILEATACALAFADLQGSRKDRAMVLFDPMTHTIQGGTGDHGEAGIRDVIESHVLCKSMDLASKEQLKAALDEKIREAEIERLVPEYNSLISTGSKVVDWRHVQITT